MIQVLGNNYFNYYDIIFEASKIYLLYVFLVLMFLLIIIKNGNGGH